MLQVQYESDTTPSNSSSQNFCSGMDASDLSAMENMYDSLTATILNFLPIFICFAALIFMANFAFIIAVVKKLRLRQLPRKRYYFELNRSFADLIAIAIALSGGAAIAVDGACTASEMCFKMVNISIMVVTNSTFISLWALTGCYVAMTVLQYVAVTRPLIYSNIVTPQKCLLVILASWLLAVFVGPIPEIIYSLMPVNFHGANLLAIVYIALLVGVYVMTVTVYIIILCLLRRQNNRFQSVNQTRSKWYGMKKLAVYLMVYSAAYLPMLILISVYWQDVGYLFDLLKETDLCHFDAALLTITKLDSNFGINVKAIAWTYLLWNFRAIWDPVTTVLMEPVLRKWFFRSSTRRTPRQLIRLRTLSSRVSLFA